MLELPESYTIAKQVKEYLQGKIISCVEVLHTPHKFAWINSEQGSVEEHLEGQTIEGATFHGGMLEITTEDSMFGKVFQTDVKVTLEESIKTGSTRCAMRVEW